MTEAPLVSVIVPFFNRGAWLREAVESVLAQTEPRWELILVDDGSTDPACLVNPTGDPRVRLVRQPNRGPAAARNHGIELARGRYVAFLDSDDRFAPGKLEAQLGLMESRPTLILSHTSYLQVDASGGALGQVRSGEFAGSVYPEIIVRCPIATPTVMIRRDGLGGLRFEEAMRAGEDVLLWVCLARRGPVAGLREPLSMVRMHGTNASTVPERFLQANLEIVRRAVEMDPSLGDGFLARAESSFYGAYASLHAEAGHRDSAWRGYRQAWRRCPTNPANYLWFLVDFSLPRGMRRWVRQLGLWTIRLRARRAPRT